jgi:hypothetical protein
VVCTFVTEFEDHIFVTVDAEAFFFLHDVISSYVKEKERVLSTQGTAGGGGAAQAGHPNPGTVVSSLGSSSKNSFFQCSGSGIRCLFDPWIRDPGWAKKSGSGSGMNNLDHFSEELRKNFLRLKYLNFSMRIRDLGWKKIRIWDGKIQISNPSNNGFFSKCDCESGKNDVDLRKFFLLINEKYPFYS